MFQLEPTTYLSVIVQALRVPRDFHTGIYLCFPLILGNLEYKTKTRQGINNKKLAIACLIFFKVIMTCLSRVMW